MISEDVNRHGRLGIAGGGLLGLDMMATLACYRIPSIERGKGAMKREHEQ